MHGEETLRESIVGITSESLAGSLSARFKDCSKASAQEKPPLGKPALQDPISIASTTYCVIELAHSPTPLKRRSQDHKSSWSNLPTKLVR